MAVGPRLGLSSAGARFTAAHHVVEHPALNERVCSRMTEQEQRRFWDGTGVCLFAKHLEDGRFQWPKIEKA